MKSFSIGVCGTGFGAPFAELFQAHPGVSEVVLADLDQARLTETAAHLGVSRTVRTFDELLASDVDAVGIFTQRYMHGPQAIAALKAGKHVYSAVPMGVTREELEEILDLVRKTGLTYMMGETSYYYPATLYCRQQFQKGAFGRVFYGEACYYHDMEDFYGIFARSGGDDWKRIASFPPMLYATHSVSMLVSVTGERMTSVSCLGSRDETDDGIFREEVSQWGNPFSNQTALFETSDNGMARINEFRRIGWHTGNSVHLSLYGTEGSYEEQSGINGPTQIWVTPQRGESFDLRPLLACNDTIHQDERTRHLEGLSEHERIDFLSGLSQVHPRNRLPAEFKGKPNGHLGSHQFLADDFVRAVNTGELPPVHAWEAARYTLPGIIAHESSMRGGERLPIPDLGNP